MALNCETLVWKGPWSGEMGFFSRGREGISVLVVARCKFNGDLLHGAGGTLLGVVCFFFPSRTSLALPGWVWGVAKE